MIFDCPPCLPVTDAVLLAAKVDGVLLVADIGQARRAGLKNTTEQFARARARLVGLVFNKVSANDRGYHPYYYRGYYGDDAPQIPDRAQTATAMVGCAGRRAGAGADPPGGEVRGAGRRMIALLSGMRSPERCHEILLCSCILGVLLAAPAGRRRHP